MIILAIETSCDETAISIVEAEGVFPDAQYRVRGNALLSQVALHREYGGVFPAMAKREHARTLVPILTRVLAEATLPHTDATPTFDAFDTLLAREYDLAADLHAFLAEQPVPQLDAIAVTHGPGLEPALWVGINFAKALAAAWNLPVVPVNHMEGHIFSSLFDGSRLASVEFPALALLISGGHTELVLMRDWNQYELIGQTRDDAVGEAFDKVARMLNLPYPGGPEISKRAEAARSTGTSSTYTFPRPMLTADHCDFSFSGLKTAVLYAIKDQTLTEEDRQAVSVAFEDAVTEVLIGKTKRAIDAHEVRTLILGGGVSANTHIRMAFTELCTDEYPDCTLYLPERALTTDNAVMIALAGHARLAFGTPPAADTIVADGNLSLAETPARKP